MKRILFLFLLTLSLPAFAGSKAVGEACTTDADCAGGVCVDLQKVIPVCQGKFCTQACQKNEDCPAVADGPDCDPDETGRQLCFYRDWAKRHCKQGP